VRRLFEVALYGPASQTTHPLDALDALVATLAAVPLGDVQAPPPARAQRIAALLNRVEGARQQVLAGDCLAAMGPVASIANMTTGPRPWLVGPSLAAVRDAVDAALDALSEGCG